MALGFATGLIIVIAMDVLLLDHMLFHELSRSNWLLPHIVYGTFASMLR